METTRQRRATTRLAPRVMVLILVVTVSSSGTTFVAATGTAGPVHGGGSNETSSFGAATVSGVSPASHPAAPGTKKVNVGADPEFVTNDSENGYIYVPNTGGSNVSVFKSNTSTSVRVGGAPLTATYDSDNGYVYVTNSGTNNVTILTGTAKAATRAVGDDPWFGAYDPWNGYVYVPNSGSGTVSVFENLTVKKNVTVGSANSVPQSAVYDSGNHWMYVSVKDSGVIAVLQGTHLIKEINTTTTTYPLVGTYDAGDGDVYIPENTNETVAVINQTKIVAQVSVCDGGQPHSVTYDPYFGLVYVVCYNNLVYALTGTSVSRHFTVGTDPLFGTVKGGNGLFAVANSGGSNVTVLDGAKYNYWNISGMTDPHSVTYAFGDGDLWVPNTGSSSATVIKDAGAYLAPCVSPRSLSANTQSGYRQTWVNWTVPTVGVGTPSFSWYSAPEYAGGALLNSPLSNYTNGSFSTNLNALDSGTTYYSYVSTYTSCIYAEGGAASGAAKVFTTSNAPLTAFVGWVYSEASSVDPHKLNPSGHPIHGASVSVEVTCPNGLTGVQRTRLEPSGVTTNSAGDYSLTTPVIFTSGTEKYELWASNNTCGEWISGVWIRGVFAGSDYILVASKAGDWNGTWTIPHALSASNDYREFVLPPNVDEDVPIGLALIRTTLNNINYSNAECGFAFKASSTKSTVNQTFYSLNSQFFGVVQHTRTVENSSKGAIYRSAPNWGNDTGLFFGYPTSGFVNESNLQALSNAYIVGNSQGFTGLLKPVQDWLWQNTTNHIPNPLPAKRPKGYGFAVAGPSNPKTSPVGNVTFSGGSFSSTTALAVNVSLPLEWDGTEVTASAKLEYTTTIQTQTSYYAECNFSWVRDPSGNGGDPYFYWFNQDTGASSSVVHVWLEGWCNGRSEPSCP